MDALRAGTSVDAELLGITKKVGTLEAGKPTVAGGRDPGYPAFLAVTFAFGGDLGSVVRLQQGAWVLLIVALAATAQAATRNAAALVPIILVAAYPGLLLFANVITAELLFTVLLNLAAAGLLVATCLGKTARCCAVAACIVCATLAVCFRSQAFLVPLVVIPGDPIQNIRQVEKVVFVMKEGVVYKDEHK